MRDFRFGVNLRTPRPAPGLADTARRIEALGFDIATMPDHLEAMVAPVAALAVVAGATERLRIGTMVFNNDFRNPVVLASEAAALDMLECPFVLIGTEDQLVAELLAHRERWGITYFTVFEPFIETFAPVIAALSN